jgi:hypothetical protein
VSQHAAAQNRAPFLTATCRDCGCFANINGVVAWRPSRWSDGRGISGSSGDGVCGGSGAAGRSQDSGQRSPRWCSTRSSDPHASYSVGPESSTALMTAAAVATLTSGNEQRYAETAAVLAIAVGAVCVRMASAAWLSGRRPVGLRSPARCGTRYARPGSHDVRRRRNRAGRARCRGFGYTLKEPDRTRSSPPYG